MSQDALSRPSITTDLLLQVFDLPVSFHRCLVPITGGVTPALMLSQAIWISQCVDCHDDGCCHPPCSPQKNTNARILQIATLLFILNMGIFLFVHKNILGLRALTAPAGPVISHSAE